MRAARVPSSCRPGGLGRRLLHPWAKAPGAAPPARPSPPQAAAATQSPALTTREKEGGSRLRPHKLSLHALQKLQRLSDTLASGTVGQEERQAQAVHEQLHQTLEQEYDELEEVFYSKRGSRISAKEQRLIEASGGSPTYGEVMPEGIDAMMGMMGDAPAGSVFMDLGSGLGRVIMQLALSPKANGFDRLIGLELSASRLDQADHVLNRLQQKYAGDVASSGALQRVQFVQADVTSSPLLEQATHVFMCSTAYGSTACRRIVEQLHASSNFKVLITSRELPFQPYLLKLGSFPLPCSWNYGSTGHIYVRGDLHNAPPHLLQRFMTDGNLCWLPSMYHHVPFAIQEPLEGFRVRWLKHNPGQ